MAGPGPITGRDPVGPRVDVAPAADRRPGPGIEREPEPETQRRDPLGDLVESLGLDRPEWPALDWLSGLLELDLWIPDLFLEWFSAPDQPVSEVEAPTGAPVPGPGEPAGSAPMAPPDTPDVADQPRTFDLPEPGAEAPPTSTPAGSAAVGVPAVEARPTGAPGVPTTAAEIQARAGRAVDQLSQPDGPNAGRTRAPIDATATEIAERSDAEAEGLRRLPAGIVVRRPWHRRPPKPDPGPIPKEMDAVRAKMNRTLTPASLPAVTRSPQGTLPDLTGPVLGDLELRAIALGDDAIAAVVSGTDDSSVAERQRLMDIRRNLGSRMASTPPPAPVDVTVPPPPLSAPVQDEPVAGAGLTPEQQAMFALVVADLRADTTDQAQRVLKSVRQAHSRFPGGVLDRAFEEPFTAGLLPEAAGDVALEATALADSLALTSDQLDLAVRLRKQQVEQLRADAAGVCVAATDDASRTAAHGDAKRRATARQTAGAVAQAAGEDRTQARPPSRTQRRVEQAMADLQAPVSSELARLDEQVRQRERAVADAIRVQVSAIRLAQTADEMALSAAPGTRGTAQDRMAAAEVRRWADAAVDALNKGEASAQATLMAAARAETETFKSELRTAVGQALAALRLWGSEHTKARDTWWADLDAQLGRWYGEALSSGTAWENQKGQASRIALAQDLESIKRISAIQGAGAQDAAKEYVQRLDGEARAVVVALSGGGQASDLTAALSAGLRERIRAGHQADWEEKMESAVMALDIGPNFKPLEVLLHEVQPGWNIDEVTEKIHKAVTRYRGHDEESIFEALGGLTRLAARMLPWYYENKIGQSLDDALRGYGHVGHLSDDEMDTAHQMLNRDRVQGAIGAIHSALMGPGAEMGAVNRILRALTPAERTQAITEYQLRYDVSLEKELRDQWTVSRSQVDESMALARSDLTGASALALKRSVVTIHTSSYGYGDGIGGYGEEDRTAVIDRGAATKVYEQIRQDVESEGTTKSWTSAQIEAEITLRSHELGVRFDEIAANEWWVKNQAPGTSATEAAFSLSSPAGKQLLQGLATNDRVKIDVAKIRIEDEGLWASDSAINAVFRDQASRSLTEVQRDWGPIMQARTDAQLRREEMGFANAEERTNRRMELERQNAEQLGRMADDHTRTRMDELGNLYQITSGRSLTDMVEDNMSFTSRREALARVEQRGVLTSYQKLKYAIEGLGTDMPMLRSTLATMSRKDLAEADLQWRKEHGGESLIAAIEDDTSGREQTDLVDMATFGVPETAQEVVQAAERKLERDQRSATGAGAYATRKESAFAARSVALLRARLEDMRRSGTDSDAQWRASTSFDIAVERANTAIELQREALDSITDMLANAAAIIAAVIVGAVLAPFTAGGSAVVAAAIISSVVATAVSIGVKQLMKGSAYGRGELATDLAIGAVDALVSALTAGLGHGLLGRAVGSASTMRSLRFAQALGRLGTLGRAAAQGRGLVARGAARFAFLEGMDQSKNFAIRMIGRGTAQLIEQGVQTVPTSFAGALLNEQLVYDPRAPGLVLEDTVSSTLHNTAMGLGLAAAHHVGSLGWHGAARGTRALVDAIRVMAPTEVRMPTGDVLAHQGTATQRLAEFRAWRETNPGGSAREFIAELKGQLIESWQLDAAERSRVRAARTELLSGLPPPERGRYADVPIRSVGDADFARMTGHAEGDAVLVVREGQAVLVVREGAAPGSVAARLPEVQQRVFPGTFGMTVEAALPTSLRDTPIRIDTTLPHDEIRVTPVPQTGPITGVEVVVGPGAHPIDVGLHAGEIRRIRNWTGRLGDARAAVARFSRKFGFEPVTPADRTRFEAAGELRKLEPLIEERIRRLAAARDPAAAAVLERRTLQLMAQHERARRILAGEIEAEPRGYVAQEGETAAAPPPPAKPTPADAVEALARLGRERAQYARNVEIAREQLALRLEPLKPYGAALADAHAELAGEFPEAGLPDVPDDGLYTHHDRQELREGLKRVQAELAKGPRDVARQRLAAELRQALAAYEKEWQGSLASRAVEEQAVWRAEETYKRANLEVAQWLEVLKGNPKAAAEAMNAKRSLMGVPLSPLLPDPKAPPGYMPNLLEGESLAKQVQHVYGLHAEAHMANRIAEDLHDTVVEFGDKVGTNGADNTSVDAAGVPTLWDSKYRSSGVKFIESETFTVDSRLRGAVDQAIQAIKRNPDGRLTQHQIDTAVQALARGDFVAYTVTSADGSTFHSAVRTTIQNFKVVKSERVAVPWGNGR